MLILLFLHFLPYQVYLFFKFIASANGSPEVIYRTRYTYALIEGAAAGSRSAAVQLVITVDRVCVGRSRLSRCELQSRRIGASYASRARVYRVSRYLISECETFKSILSFAIVSNFN